MSSKEEKKAKAAELAAQKKAEKEAAKEAAKAEADAKKNEVTFMCTAGHQVADKNYVYNKDKEKEVHAPEFVLKKIGTPVTDVDLIDAFHKVFAPADEFLFYKENRREVYLIVVPLKFVTELGEEEDSVSGDMQIHAMSFIHEGSVTMDVLAAKLKLIAKNLNYSK